MAPYIAELAIETAGGDVDGDRVSEIAEHLDASVPACEPTPAASQPDDLTIGYTEEIVVSGTSGSAQAVAKADTGAGRTSIDTAIAATIGAEPVQTTTTVKSATADSSRSRLVVDMVFGIGGTRHTVAASIEGVSHHWRGACPENPASIG